MKRHLDMMFTMFSGLCLRYIISYNDRCMWNYFESWNAFFVETRQHVWGKYIKYNNSKQTWYSKEEEETTSIIYLAIQKIVHSYQWHLFQPRLLLCCLHRKSFLCAEICNSKQGEYCIRHLQSAEFGWSCIFIVQVVVAYLGKKQTEEWM